MAGSHELENKKNLEIKTLLLKIKILGEIFREAGTNTRCFVKDLNSLDCRRGCMICVLEKIAKRMAEGFQTVEEGPGKNTLIKYGRF